MNAQDILNLVKAGFSHDEIIALEQETVPVPVDPVPTVAPNPAPVPEPDHKPAPAPAPAPAPVPDPVPAAESDQPSIADLIKANQDLQLQVAKLTSTMQANAIAGSMIPGGMPQQPDAAAVLGQIIRPTRSKKEE